MAWPSGKRYVLDYCHHFRSGVPRDSNHISECDASALMIGEAPGREEDEKGIPFQGSAGRLWEKELLKDTGLSRDDFYITNVIPYKPPGNKFEIAYSVPGLVEEGRLRVVRKVHDFMGTVVVPTGNVALTATTGQKGIMKWRGSVLSSETGKWVIPTIHPAAALRQHILVKTMRYDWQRIATVVKNGWSFPDYELIATVHNDHRLRELFNAKVLSVDIETVIDTCKILCIAFCADVTRSYSVDCRHGIPPIVQELLTSRIPKVLQGGWFDAYVLAENGCEVENYIWDTAAMFHALDNNVGPQTATSSEGGGKSTIKPYSLAYMASIFTPFNYWKESAKDEGTGENYGAYKSNWKRFQEYNAMDALGTLYIARELRRRLQAAGRIEWYHEQYSRLFRPLVRLSLHGVRFDAEGAAKLAERLLSRLDDIRGDIEHLAGRPLHGVKVFKKEPKKKEGRADGLRIRQTELATWIGEKSSLSNKELHAYLYNELKLKRQLKDGKTTADEVAIRNLQIFVKEDPKWKGDRNAASKVLEAILSFRETEKTIQFLSAKSVDSDGRIRAAYSLLTQTGRLRSYSNPRGTGFNLQNVQRNVRHFFLPDKEGWYFLELDYKQAEDLAVKTMASAVTGDPRPLELVRHVQTGDVDIHRRLAALVFGVRETDIDYAKRYVTKRCRHGKNNGMKYKRMQSTLLKDGFVFASHEVKAMMDAIDAAEPWVPEFHRAIRSAIWKTGKVVNSWGWQLDTAGEFRYNSLDDPSVYNRCYAFIEQSEVGVLMKQYGLLTYEKLIEPNYQSRLNMLVHDNVVLSCPEEELFDVATILAASLEKERTYGVRTCLDDRDAIVLPLSIPVEIKISRHLSCTCDDCKKEKSLELPSGLSRDEFYARFHRWKESINETAS